MKKIELQHVAKIPTEPKGFEFVSSNVSIAGQGLFLFVEKKAINRVYKYLVGKGGVRVPSLKMDADYRYKLIATDGISSQEIDLPVCDITFPKFDVFSDGSIMIVGTRCQWRSENDYDLNGMIFDPTTGQDTRFLAGDGIQGIGIDGKDRVWVSYFDEGIFGNFGWGRGDAPAPVGCFGLNCFDKTGKIVWRNDQEDRFIDDCYALNVTVDAVHFYYYSDFNLGTISEDFDARFRKIDLSGCHAFAIAKNKALFTKQYREPADTVHLMSFEHSKAAKYEKCTLALPNSKNLDSGKFVGRGDELHFFSETEWFKVNISNM